MRYELRTTHYGLNRVLFNLKFVHFILSKKNGRVSCPLVYSTVIGGNIEDCIYKTRKGNKKIVLIYFKRDKVLTSAALCRSNFRAFKPVLSEMLFVSKKLSISETCD